MKIRAGVAVVLLLGAAAAGFFFLRGGPGRKGGAPAAGPEAVLTPGGDNLVLEIFAPDGRRLWRLRLREASLAAGDLLVAAAVRADYYGTAPPSVINADKLLYEQGPARLLLRGVAVSGPALSLRGGELIWDAAARSFTVQGGYTLNKDKAALEGDRLLADEGFGSLRTLGPARLRVPLERSGRE